MAPNPMQPTPPDVEIFTDGGCSPNPGPGGYGVILVCQGRRKELSGAYRSTTNNRMEILAVIKGLESLNRPCRVTLHSDSKYLVNAMSKGWVKKWRTAGWWRTRTSRPANVDLWKRLDALCDSHTVKFQWVRGHVGHPENERCDELCHKARQQARLPSDEGHEAALKNHNFHTPELPANPRQGRRQEDFMDAPLLFSAGAKQTTVDG